MIDDLMMEYHDTKEPEQEEWEENQMMGQQLELAREIILRNERGR